MKRKIMMLALVLGAISFFIATTKPVGAITRSYTEATKKLTEELDNLDYGYSVGYYYERKRDAIIDLFNLGSYLINKSEYDEVEYKQCLEELVQVLSSHKNYLKRVPVKALYTDDHNGVNNRIANLSQRQYETIIDNLNQALQKFASETVRIQINNPKLISIPTHLPKNSDYINFKTRLDNGYNDEFYYNYLIKSREITTLQKMLTIYRRDYFERLHELSQHINTIEDDLTRYDEDLQNEYFIIMNKSNGDKTKIILAETLPTIRILENTITDLAYISKKQKGEHFDMEPGLTLFDPVKVTDREYDEQINTSRRGNLEGTNSSYGNVLTPRTSAHRASLATAHLSYEDNDENIVKAQFAVEYFNNAYNKFRYTDGINDENRKKGEEFYNRGVSLRAELDNFLATPGQFRQSLKDALTNLETITRSIEGILSYDVASQTK
ncbi:hypothetical protein ACVRW4_04680 [Streptococcus phocae subsp. phocae]